MELLQLTYFITAAENESFTAAAKKHGVPTSDISQTIKRLERELGVQLFLRSANRVTISPEGKSFLSSSRLIMNELESAKRCILDCRDTVSGEIRLLVLTNRRVVTEAIEKYHAIYPEVAFVISHTSGDESDFDIIISDTEPGGSGFEKHPLINERIFLAVSKSNASLLMDKDGTGIDTSLLEKMPFITMPESTSHYRITKKICEEKGFTPNIGICCDDPYYIRKYIEMGLGAAFVPEFSWKGLISDKILLSDISAFTRATYMFLSSRGKSVRAAMLFVPLLEEAFGKK